ncbi:MAG: non-heme iron oxygenase ferredoxin subunit [Chloroflexi bacterium]|nr:non-heme iron oxygenase ferredoxin subunit [Chloroflexota bacterium]
MTAADLEYVTVARADDVPPGALYEAELDGEPLLIVNVEGTLYACAALCTHLDGPLSQGVLTGAVLRCPWHGSTFDVRSGEALGRPAREPLRGYALRVHAGEIQVARP